MPKTRERMGDLEFSYFLKDDYVCTASGVAKVIEDEPVIRSERQYNASVVLIRYKDGTAQHVSRFKLERTSASAYMKGE